MFTFDSTILPAKRQLGDPLADATVAAIVAKEGAPDAKALFDLLIRRVEMPVAELPPSVDDYLAATRQLPDWADAERIARARRFFHDHGPKLLLLLYYKSLPMLYSCAHGAEVLVRTARLTRGREDWTIFTRRIAETAQFLLGVMAPGSLVPEGEGIRLIQKIRLIHAGIRFFLTSEGWDKATFGEPINQEDLAITLCSFSISLVDGLAKLGVPVSPEEADAFVHTWSAIGHVLGLDDDLLPHGPAVAREMEFVILERQSRASEAGRTLTDALLRFAEKMMPHESLAVAPAGLLRYCLGTERARLLGVTPNYGCIAWLVPEVLAAYFRTGERLEDKSPEGLRQLMDQASCLLTQGMFRYFDHYKNRPFQVPASFQRAWDI